MRNIMATGLSALVLGLTIAGCNRGLFISSPCTAAQRHALDSRAASAIYLDNEGNPINPRAELLKDTRTATPTDISVNNVYCPK